MAMNGDRSRTKRNKKPGTSSAVRAGKRGTSRRLARAAKARAAGQRSGDFPETAPKRPREAARSRADRRRHEDAPPHTLAIDVGGTGLKAAVLDMSGKMLTERVRVETPHPCTPEILVDTLTQLVKPLPPYQRISVGFPGLIRHGRVITAPNLSTEAFAGFDLASALAKRLGAPVRAINDADMQGLAVISGEGVEMVITLGTGFGTALFSDGRLQTHLEIAHHPFKKGRTYDHFLGDRARKATGNKKWRRNVEEAIENMRTMVSFDRMYIGGGNARRLEPPFPSDVVIVDNSAGILGGIKLWDELLADV